MSQHPCLPSPCVGCPEGSRWQQAHDQLAHRVEELERQLQERRRLEEALRESEYQYRCLVENATDVIFTLSAAGTITSLNPAFEILTGWSRAEWLDHPFVAMLHPDDRAFALQLLQRVLQGDIPPVFESRLLLARSREYLRGEVTLTPYIRNGAVRAILGAVRDITQRKRMERALEYRTTLENLVTTISTHFINLMPEEIDNGITAGLQAIGEFAGADRSYIFLFSNDGSQMSNTHEWCATGIESQMDKRQRVPLARIPWWMEQLHRFEHIHIPRVADLPPEATAEKVLLQAQGIRSLIVVAMVSGRSLKGFLGFDSVRQEQSWAEDIIALFKLVGEMFANALARKQAEVERKKIERLKDELVSTVSHELRTPLTSLRGFAELMLEREFPSEKQHEFLTVIHNESLRLTNLINDFLDLQRLESGHQTYDFRSVDLGEVLRETVTLFAHEDRHHTLRLVLPPSLPPVRADADRLRQVLSNLLSNAVKFSPQGGEVTLGARLEGRKKVVVWVADQGVGIPPEEMHKLFSKFFRIDNTETRSIGGTGLGLALVKEIVEAHGGQVWAESTSGQGSTFFFTLPTATWDTLATAAVIESSRPPA